MEQPWKQALLEALEGGDWHPYNDVLSAVAPTVPPDMAFQKAEYYRQYHYRKKGKQPSDRQHGTNLDTVKTGQRFIVSRTIQNLKRRGLVEVEGKTLPGGTRQRPYRIRLVGT